MIATREELFEVSNYLNRLSEIPRCIPGRAQLIELNQKASARQGYSDDSFSAADFRYARTQPWGSPLKRFANYADFRQRMSEHIARELLNEPCQQEDCLRRGGNVWPQGDTWVCQEPLKQPPPRTPPRRRAKSPARKKPTPPKPPPVLDISKLKIPETPWWSQKTPAPQTPQKPEVIASLTPDALRVKNDSLQRLIDSMYDPKGLVKAFVGKILKTAKQQAGTGGIAGKVVDVVFAIDHSSSMGPAASLVVGSVDQIIRGLEKTGAKQILFGVVLFNDRDRIEVVPLTEMNPENKRLLINKLSTLYFSGGREPVGLATNQALSLLGKSGHSQQVIVLTDLDGLSNDQSYSLTLKDARQQALSRGIPVNLFNLSGRRPPKQSTRQKVAATVDSIVPGAGLLIDPIETLRKRYAPGQVPNGSRGRPIRP